MSTDQAPRVGDTIANQPYAAAEVAESNGHYTVVAATGEQPRPAECCGVCPPIIEGGYDCTCKDSPRCPGPATVVAVEDARAPATDRLAPLYDAGVLPTAPAAGRGTSYQPPEGAHLVLHHARNAARMRQTKAQLLDLIASLADALRLFADLHVDGVAASRAVPSDSGDDGTAWDPGAKADYQAGRWCGECRYGVVENPPCCTQPAVPSDHTATTEDAETAIWRDLLDTWGTSASGRRTMAPATALGITRYVIDALKGRGLLATARPDTTTEWGVANLHVNGVLYWTTDEHAARTDAAREGRRLVRREVTTWTEAGQ